MQSTPQIRPQESAAPLPPGGNRLPPGGTQAPAEPPQPTAAGLRKAWGVSLAIFAVCSLALGWIFWNEIAAAVRVWNTSRTYGHAYFILPISLFLLYRLRHRLAAVRPRAAPWALLPMVGLTLLWVIGDLANLMVVKQFAIVGLWQSLFLLVLGAEAARVALFPLAYLYLAVPFGYSVIPMLQDVTAQMVVHLLRLTGMPVFLDGYFIQIPSGAFLVAEACSGVRYLIVSVALGILAAYLFFRSWKRRLLFVGLSILVPIVANGIRAYGIVMLAHLSDYELAVDVDHIIYGFVFLGIVTLTLLGIAAVLRDRSDPLMDDQPGPAGAPQPRRAGLGLPGQALLGALAVLAIFGAQTWLAVAKAPPDTAAIRLRPPAAMAPWAAAETTAPQWLPRLPGADATLHQAYRRDDGEVELHVSYFAYQREGAEAISDVNNLLGDSQKWRLIGVRRSEIELPGGPHPLNEMVLRKGGETYLLWVWYRIGGEATNSRILGKLLEMKAIAFGGERAAAVVAIGAKVSEDNEQTKALLGAFLRRSMAENGSLVLLDREPAKSGTVMLGTTSPGESTGGAPKP